MPIMSSFSTAAANAYGFAYAFSKRITESFSRSVADLNGQRTSDGSSTWIVSRGLWSMNGTQAISSNTDYSTALVGTSSSNISNAQVDIPDGGGGVGLSFWASDAGSMWAAYSKYFTSTTTGQACTGNTIGTQGECTGNALRCSGCTATTYYVCLCGYGDEYLKTTTWTTTQCTNLCSMSGGIAARNSTVTYYAFSFYQTVTTTNYVSQFNIDYYNGSSWTNKHQNNYNQNTSGTYSNAYSIAISTSGSIIYYNLYSAVNKGGSVLASSSYTIGSENIGLKAGIVKTSSVVSQGSSLSNFSITTS